RARYDSPGPGPAAIDRVRDKTVMKRVLAAAGVRVPRWFPCRSAAEVLADGRALGFPLILKPTRGASSQGVRKIASAEELEAVCLQQPLDGHEIEEYVDGDVLHADGVVDGDGRCLFMSVSRYISSCLEFEAGAPLGSVIQTDPGVRAEGRRVARRCLAALGLRASAFHLEFFDTGRELVFLEIGGRVPGADVSYVIHDVYGVNLFRLWVDVLLGRGAAAVADGGAASGGWLTIPRPRPLPQTVLHATPLLGTIPFLYRELVPRPGQVLEHAGGYSNWQGGRFLFRGGTQREIGEAIQAARAGYRLTTAPGS
ncbi:MAG TPA: ATP-grasp domain-containing protein, partial [Methylomirabilota bacterium]|nr:ATP-grasp domain-containing protein [Methylomirabilota bacterium]